MVSDTVTKSIERVINHTREVLTKEGPSNWETGANNSDMHLYHPEIRLAMSFWFSKLLYTNHHIP
jgi:hypothetical protein